MGVCVGHAELVKGRELGVYASIESIRALLEQAKLTAVVASSERRRPRGRRLPDEERGRARPIAIDRDPDPIRWRSAAGAHDARIDGNRRRP